MLVESAALAVVFTFRIPLCAAAPHAQIGGSMQMPLGGGGSDAGSGTAAVAPVAAPSALPAPTGSPADAAAPAGNANAQGDLNQVPDPNCVAKAAAGVLNTNSVSATPSCPPMSPSPELKNAEQQVQSSP
ncbi:MAG TPA: hypothetical protein VGG89_13935 [Candidatus Baltobacteraceae bacterium]